MQLGSDENRLIYENAVKSKNTHKMVCLFLNLGTAFGVYIVSNKKTS